MLKAGLLTLGRRIACGACALLASCGDSSHDDPDGTPDASDSSAQTITIRFKSSAALALIAFRDGPAGAWRTPIAAAESGSYQFVVHGPYTVVDVCTYPGAAVTLALSRTPDDPHDLNMSCSSGDPVPLSHVTGSMGVSGFVSVGPRSALARFDGAFEVQVADGIYDVIARDASPISFMDRVAIRRNVVIAGDTMVTPAIDVAAEGIAMTYAEPRVTGLAAGETLAMTGVLHTPTAMTNVTYPSCPCVHVLPDAALGPGDTQSIEIVASTNTATKFTQRKITRRYVEGTSVVFVLPPALPVQYTTSAGLPIATWSNLPPFDRLQFSIGQTVLNNAGLAVMHTVDLSPSYVAAIGATSVAFDTNLPGYDPAWRTDITLSWGRSAQLRHSDGSDTVSLVHDETLEQPQELQSRATADCDDCQVARGRTNVRARTNAVAGQLWRAWP